MREEKTVLVWLISDTPIQVSIIQSNEAKPRKFWKTTTRRVRGSERERERKWLTFAQKLYTEYWILVMHLLLLL